MKQKQSELTGVISLIICGILYSFYSVYSRLMGSSFAPFYQVWTRGLINIAILLLVILVTKTFIFPEKKDYKYFFLAGAFGGFADVFFFMAVNHLPLGVALFVFYAFINVLGYFWGNRLFGERIDTMKKIAITLAIIGLILIYKNELDFAHTNIISLLIAAIAGACVSIYFAFSKMISDRYSSFQIALSNNIFGFLVIIPISFVLVEPMNTNFQSFPWFINLLFALTQVIIMPLVVYGFKHIEVQKGSLILLLELIGGVLWGFLFFKEVPNPMTLIGILFIGTALVLPLLKSTNEKSEVIEARAEF